MMQRTIYILLLLTGLLVTNANGVVFLIPDGEDCVELCESEQLQHLWRRPEQCHLASSSLNRSPDCDQLTQTKTVDVRNVGQVNDEFPASLPQQFLDFFAQRNFQEIESSRQIDDDHAGNSS